MSKKAKLTLKQEKFVQNLIQGMSQREAYKTAFEVNYKDSAIDSKASDLLSKPHIQEYYRKLTGELESKAVMTSQERLEFLTSVVKDDPEAGLGDKLRAVDLMNKMTGEYITKIEADVDTEVNINVELVD